MSGAAWADHFSAAAPDYSRYRPHYPAALFGYLASCCSTRHTAWDCACGNGQAAVALRSHFSTVIASDASTRQLAHAAAAIPKFASQAEHVALRDGTVDLIAIAQALHWFAGASFFAEVARVARPGAVLSAWTYNLLRCEEAIDSILDRLAYSTVGDYWPAGRALVDGAYRDLAIPFSEITPPSFSMQAEWSLSHLLGYVRTWTAVQRYRRAHRDDPVAAIEPRLRSTWGDPERRRTVFWPLTVRVAQVTR